MPTPVSHFARTRVSALLAPGAILALVALAACGNSSFSGSTGGAPPPPLNTSVTVLFSSTANDSLTNFSIGISSIVLTNQAGGTVSVYASPLSNAAGPEFIRLNGAVEPFTTVQIPEGTYTGATVTLSGCEFTNVFYNQGLNTATWDEGYCSEGTGRSTVNLAAPVAISGSAMALAFNLQVAQSYTLDLDESNTAFSTYTIDPVFTLSPITISAAPTSIANGRILGLNGSLNSVGATKTTNFFSMLLADGTVVTANMNSSTVFQGISGMSALGPTGTVNVDLALQSDGSMLATRVEMDTTSTLLSDSGYWLTFYGAENIYTSTANDQVGCINGTPPYLCGGLYQSYAGTNYFVSGEFTNLASLPFTPTFNATTTALAQYTRASLATGGGTQNYPTADALTLQPQTVNGAVQSVANQNGTAVYTVVLAPYNLFSTTQADYLPGTQTLTTPNTVTVYADSSTQFLHTAMIEEGDLLRFRGVIFNDGGTLRMDCNEILDGVAE
jgi:hypothetical protein